MAAEGISVKELKQPLTEGQVNDFIEIFETFHHVGCVMWMPAPKASYLGATKTHHSGDTVVHSVRLRVLDLFVLKHELAHCIVDFENPRCREAHGKEFDRALARVERTFYHWRNWPNESI